MKDSPKIIESLYVGDRQVMIVAAGHACGLDNYAHIKEVWGIEVEETIIDGREINDTGTYLFAFLLAEDPHCSIHG